MIASPARPDNASIADAGRRAVGAGAGLSYLAHFGLKEPPFRLTPDTDFFFASPPHREALNTLLYALENGEGFIKIVGAVGTGKTLLCRMLLASLPTSCQAVYLPNPALDPAGVLLGVAEELGIAPDGSGFGVHKAIQSRLLELAQRDIHVVLILDEAQAIPPDSLETLRLLSNLETEKRKLLTIVLFGQPELDARLDAIPQLKTRISFHERLRALDPRRAGGLPRSSAPTRGAVGGRARALHAARAARAAPGEWGCAAHRQRRRAQSAAARLRTRPATRRLARSAARRARHRPHRVARSRSYAARRARRTVRRRDGRGALSRAIALRSSVP